MIDILVPALQFTKALLEILNIINMMAQKHSAIACPANILAKSRTIKARGFVNIPKISIIGINGIGNFIQVGTSGQNISFQYSFVPVKLVIRKVHVPKKNVQVILPVKLLRLEGMGLIP